MIRAVIFDLDGTLIDSTEAIVESFFHTFDTLQQPRLARQAIVKDIGHPLHEQFKLLWPGCDADRCVQVYRAYYPTICLPKTFLLPGTAGMLQALAEANIRMGFASSKKLEFCEMILAH